MAEDTSNLLTSPLHERHVALGAKLAEFGGWLMPLEYTGAVKEHNAVRAGVGVFDVSHLGKAVVSGAGAAELRQRVSDQRPRPDPRRQGAVHLCCRPDGGVVDDLIAYLRGDDEVFLIPNAANTTEVVRLLTASAPEGVTVANLHRDYAILAVQGRPQRRAAVGDRVPRRPRVHVVRRGRPRGRTCRRVPYRLHGGARLRARRTQRRRRLRLGRADGRGGAVRRRPRRTGGSRHAAHRDGLPPARAGHLARDHPGPGSARVGCRLEQGGVLGRRGAACRA